MISLGYVKLEVKVKDKYTTIVFSFFIKHDVNKYLYSL